MTRLRIVSMRWRPVLEQKGASSRSLRHPAGAISDAELVTLAAWALVEDGDGQTQLVGLVQKPQRDDSPAGTFGFADETDGFVGYSNQGLKTKPAD